MGSQHRREDDREYRTWRKSIMLVWSSLATHKYASLFLRPITNDQAPGYHSCVSRPMDLHTIKKNLEAGIIRSTEEFRHAVMLMFVNALMYNSSDHDVSHLTRVMQKDCMRHVQDYINTQKMVQTAEGRRETREAAKRNEAVAESEESGMGHKRKRSTVGSTPDERIHKKRKGND